MIGTRSMIASEVGNITQGILVAVPKIDQIMCGIKINECLLVLTHFQVVMVIRHHLRRLPVHRPRLHPRLRIKVMMKEDQERGAETAATGKTWRSRIILRTEGLCLCLNS